MDQWRRQAQIIHLALVGGVVLALMVFAVVRRTSTGVPAAAPVAQALGILGGAMLVAAMAAAAVLARRREGAPEGDDASRRRRAFTTLVAIWAMGEGAALLSGVAWLLAGGPWRLVLAGAGVLFLVANAPGRRLPS